MGDRSIQKALYGTVGSGGLFASKPGVHTINAQHLPASSESADYLDVNGAAERAADSDYDRFADSKNTEQASPKKEKKKKKKKKKAEKAENETVVRNYSSSNPDDLSGSDLDI